jgi:hypothetical protein
LCKERKVVTKQILDKAEVALEYPDKFYSGTFERSSRFETALDTTGVALVLERPGSEDVRKSVHIHINYGLFADIVQQLALNVPKIPSGEVHLPALREAVASLYRALRSM